MPELLLLILSTFCFQSAQHCAKVLCAQKCPLPLSVLVLRERCPGRHSGGKSDHVTSHATAFFIVKRADSSLKVKTVRIQLDISHKAVILENVVMPQPGRAM